MEPHQYQELIGLIHRLLAEQTNTREKLTQELATYKHNLQDAQKELEYLRGQLRMQEIVLAAKEETIMLLRASFNRPN